MNLFAIPPGRPFLDDLAAGVIERVGDASPEALARVTILLPTRRSARALRAAFLRVSDRPALLLPRMRALAGLSVEEADELALPALLDLPPAVPMLTRQAVLTAFAARWPKHAGGPPTAEHAWALGGELAKLLDEIALEEADPLPDDPALLEHRWLTRLDDLAPEALSQHWQITTAFLRAAVTDWQAWLSERGLLDAGMRRVLALRAQRRAWEESPPADPVIAAGIGMGGTIPAAADLLRVIAQKLPRGAVVVAGEDSWTAALPADALAEAPTHPFAGQRAMLARMGATSADIAPWRGGEASPRSALLGMALLPAGHLAPWQARQPARWQEALAGVTRIEAADAQQEAAAIALALRGALEVPGARVALVTPDRDLARRVAAELPRHGVLADDSAGQPLSDTPAGAFLRLLARLAVGDAGPVALLALLKHPLSSAGMPRADFANAVRQLELKALRGPAPAPGLAGLRALNLAQIAPLLDALEAALGAFLALGTGRPEAWLEAHLAAAEALASTPELPGGLRLYARAEGEALARHLAELPPALAELPPVEATDWPGLFDALLAAGVTRAERVARGRDGAQAHPQVEILGLLEARLLDHDVVVLGALDETIWPLAADPGPWMSRPMRADFGLPSPELRIGRVAADFLLLAANARRTVLSRASRRGGAPTVPARWLTRLDTFLAGQQLVLEADPAMAWARALDQPTEAPRPCARPAPRPPRDSRPTEISASDVERLIADPYAFYAKHVLRLAPLDPLEQEPDAADYGTLVHAAMHAWLKALPRPWPGHDVALRAWSKASAEAFAKAPPRAAVAALWQRRLARIGGFVALLEQDDAQAEFAETLTERPGRLVLHRPRGDVTLKARADRLDRDETGGVRIVDYKTGTVPSKKAVALGTHPQLVLEALIADAGGFESLPALRATTLEYWRLTGGSEPGERKELDLDLPTLLPAARDSLNALADDFLLGEAAFTAQPHPSRRASPDYRHLARTDEWSAGEEPA